MTIMGINVSEFVKDNIVSVKNNIINQPIQTTGIVVCVALFAIGCIANKTRTDDENKYQTYFGLGAGVMLSLAPKKWLLIPGKTTQGGLFIAGLAQLSALQLFTSLSDWKKWHDSIPKWTKDYVFPNKHLWHHIAGLVTSMGLCIICNAIFKKINLKVNSGLSTHAFCCMALPIALTQAWVNLYFRKS